MATDFDPFVGTWKATPGAPLSNHTFTWAVSDDGLRGQWIIEATAQPETRAAIEAGGPTRLEMQVGEPSLEDGILLFRTNGGPFITEFRIVGGDEAILGAAVHKLPSQLAGSGLERSAQAHRVRFTRQSLQTR